MPAKLSGLHEAIAAEAAAMIAFVSLLEEEKQLLLNGSPDEILANNEKKSALVVQLTHAGNARDAAFSALGVEQTRQAVNDFLAAQKATDLQSAWATLIDLARTANQLNGSNATLLNSRLQTNQQALSILLSASGQTADNTVYGPDGHSKHGSTPRPLGSA